MEEALEIEHIDMAMAALGTTRDLKGEENVIVARGGGSKSVQAGLGHATSHLAGRLLDAGQLQNFVQCVHGERTGTVSRKRDTARTKRCAECLEWCHLQWSSEFSV